MVSPIQGFIGVAAAGAQANHVAAAAGKGPVSDSNIQNSGVQQVIAAEATKGIKPFEKRTTSGETALDASFDSNNSEGGGAGGHEGEEENNQQLNDNSDNLEPQKKKLLDVIA